MIFVGSGVTELMTLMTRVLDITDQYRSVSALCMGETLTYFKTAKQVSSCRVHFGCVRKYQTSYSQISWVADHHYDFFLACWLYALPLNRQIPLINHAYQMSLTPADADKMCVVLRREDCINNYHQQIFETPPRHSSEGGQKRLASGKSNECIPSIVCKFSHMFSWDYVR